MRKLIVLLLFFCSAYVSAQPANDNKASATPISTGCSANGAYTTVAATADQAAGSCAPNGPNYNVWFSFTATTNFINVQLKSGGALGTMQYGWATLWDGAGTQLACSPYNSQQYGTMEFNYLGLTPGTTYYISVDNFVGVGYRGTFSLCLNDVVNYDYKSGALDVTSVINSCSANAAYTTLGAGADQAAGTCAPNGPNYNRWFSFVATGTTFINVQLKTGGALGTMQYGWATLWTGAGAQLACSPYNSQQYGTMEFNYLGLTAGTTYYISVDNFVGVGYRGTFSLCLNDVVNYDYKQGAFDATTIINGCSSNAAFTTLSASADQAAGTCAPNGPNYNRWFKFTATSTTFINVQLKSGGAFGTMQYGWATLWDGAGMQLACSPYNSQQYGTREFSYLGLTSGATYYISVDNFVGLNYRGTFSLCLTDVLDYNFYEGATSLTNLNNWCSANAAYTTVGASADRSKGSCWNNGPNYNRWFKFVAVTPNATIQVTTGGANGTMQFGYLALWQSNGTTQIACTQYSTQYGTLSVSSSALVVGNTYYISVDNFALINYPGSFKLCINNIGTTYYSRASAAWNLASTWSTIGFGGAAASFYPTAGDVALIQGHDITVSANQQVAEIGMTVATNNTTLIIDNASLTVSGLLSLVNSGNNFLGTLTVQNSGTVFINDNLILTRSGGNQPFGVTVNTGSALSINTDLNFNSSGGSVNNTLLTVNGTGTVTVARDVNLTSTGGPLIKLQFNNTSLFTVVRDINYSATAGGQEAIELNNTAKLLLKRNLVRGVTPYGALTCNGSSIVEFGSNVFPQTVAADAGAGGDAISYMNVIFNSTSPFSPQITLGGSTTVNGNLTMTAGLVSTTSTNILNLKNTSVTSIGNSSCYIDGPMTYEVATNTPNTNRNFPLGKNGSYRPATLRVTHSDASSVIYTAEHFSSSAVALGYTLPITVDRVSSVRYWRISRPGVANFTTGNVTLYYGIGTSDGVTNFGQLTVVKNIGAGTTWFDIGGTATGNGSGSIASGPFTSFSDFTLGDLNGGGNPLPIQLVSFNAKATGQSVQLNWVTSSELNNDFFTIERSKTGIEFSKVAIVRGAGTTTSTSRYEIIDEYSLPGLVYYRLKQTDFNGNSSFSKIVPVYSNPVTTALVDVFPNPTNGSDFKIKISGFENDEELLISLIDTFGKYHWSSLHRMNRLEDNLMDVKLANTLAAGVYIVLVNSRNRSIHTRVIIR
ncbi:MAG: T9SS type A sorting domain-containing protein [Cyclobacteriaceae bacterium]|nr:T9SS type A sorting domain-containing protein [Cyclobacteriaceae bacterium]